MAAIIIGLKRKPKAVFWVTVVDVDITVIVGVAVAVGVICVHHWLIEEESEASTKACNSCVVKPVVTAAGRINCWFACIVTVLFV